MARVPPIVLLALLIIMVILVIVQVGILSDLVDLILNGNVGASTHSNAATSFMLIFSALADVTAAATFVIGVIHYFSRDAITRVATASFSLYTLVVFALAFGFGCKQADLGHTGSKQDTVFAFTTVLTFLMLLITAVAWLMHEWGPNYGLGPGAGGPAGVKAAGMDPAIGGAGYGGAAQPGFDGMQRPAV